MSCDMKEKEERRGERGRERVETRRYNDAHFKLL